jgi:hypothetical protein
MWAFCHVEPDADADSPFLSVPFSKLMALLWSLRRNAETFRAYAYVKKE